MRFDPFASVSFSARAASAIPHARSTRAASFARDVPRIVHRIAQRVDRGSDRGSVFLLLAASLVFGIVSNAGGALAVTTTPTAFTLELRTADFESRNITPSFSNVRNFAFEFDLFGSFAPGQKFGNANIEEVRYVVNGSLSVNPPTPSGFRAFALNRFATGEGPISPLDWSQQGSSLRFEIAGDADLSDGLQIAELVPDAKSGAALSIDARERGRLDRARYHPPQFLLFPDGTGLFQSSLNSSEKTGTVNPATGLEVNLNFGDEYITRLRFDPTQLTIVGPPDSLPVPEPGTVVLMGLGLFVLAARASRDRGA